MFSWYILYIYLNKIIFSLKFSKKAGEDDFLQSWLANSTKKNTVELQVHPETEDNLLAYFPTK